MAYFIQSSNTRSHQSIFSMSRYLSWVEKHRPVILSDIHHSSNILDLLKKCSDSKNLSHLLFWGPPGTGKTSSITVLARELFGPLFSERYFEYNASDDKGIDAIKGKIMDAAKKTVKLIDSQDTISLSDIPPYKIIVLDEADYITDEAQSALRIMMEHYSKTTRFCLICNSITKIIDAIKSRCYVLHFKKLDNSIMLTKLRDIAHKESVSISETALTKIIELSNGDMRKSIMLLQHSYSWQQYKLFIKQPIPSRSAAGLLLLSKMNFTAFNGSINRYTNIDTTITEEDICKHAIVISQATIQDIISKTTACSSVYDLTRLAREIVGYGFSIDDTINHVDMYLMDVIVDERQMQVFVVSNEILHNLKEGASEYLQVLKYLTVIRDLFRAS